MISWFQTFAFKLYVYRYIMAKMGCVVGVKVSATGYHFLSLLEGKAHSGLLLREGAKKWDTCAGEALLRAVGGVVTDTVVAPLYKLNPVVTHSFDSAWFLPLEPIK